MVQFFPAMIERYGITMPAHAASEVHKKYASLQKNKKHIDWGV